MGERAGRGPEHRRRAVVSRMTSENLEDRFWIPTSFQIPQRTRACSLPLLQNPARYYPDQWGVNFITDTIGHVNLVNEH